MKPKWMEIAGLGIRLVALGVCFFAFAAMVRPEIGQYLIPKVVEASRAYAALDGRNEVCWDDLQVIAPMALRMRRSKFIENYLGEQTREEEAIKHTLDHLSTRS